MDTKTKAAAERLIKPLESKGSMPNLKAYKDFARGTLTNGWGNTRGVVEGSTITYDQAVADLDRNLGEADATFNRTVKVALNSNQHAACLSFIFNEGGPAWETSALLKAINEGNTTAIKVQWMRWTKAHDNAGREFDSPGLQKRRIAELALFNTPEPGAGPEDSVSTIGTGPALTPPQPTSVIQTSTGKTQIGVGVATTVTVGAAVTESLQHTTDTLTQVTGVGSALAAVWSVLHSVPLVVALIGGTVVMGFVAYTWFERHKKLQDTKQ